MEKLPEETNTVKNHIWLLITLCPFRVKKKNLLTVQSLFVGLKMCIFSANFIILNTWEQLPILFLYFMIVALISFPI